MPYGTAGGRSVNWICAERAPQNAPYAQWMPAPSRCRFSSEARSGRCASPAARRLARSAGPGCRRPERSGPSTIGVVVWIVGGRAPGPAGSGRPPGVRPSSPACRRVRRPLPSASPQTDSRTRSNEASGALRISDLRRCGAAPRRPEAPRRRMVPLRLVTGSRPAACQATGCQRSAPLVDLAPARAARRRPRPGTASSGQRWNASWRRSAAPRSSVLLFRRNIACWLTWALAAASLRSNHGAMSRTMSAGSSWFDHPVGLGSPVLAHQVRSSCGLPRRERAQRRHDRPVGVDVLRMAVLAVRAVGDRRCPA